MNPSGLDRVRGSRLVTTAGLLLGLSFSSALAERSEPLPKQLDGVGITERLATALPADLEFTNEEGATIRLGDYFTGAKPVILTLNYYRCPMLCTLILNGMIEALENANMTPGRDFEIVTVSIDPSETPTLAKQKKQAYLAGLGTAEAGEAWHFLTGGEAAIRRLTAAVGFGYRYDEDRKEYAHAAVLLVCTPDGKISRYLYGVRFEPRTLRLALVEASQGLVGSTLEQLILYCYHYDPSTGTYALAAMKLMRVAGLLTVLILGAVISALWIRDVRRRQEA